MHFDRDSLHQDPGSLSIVSQRVVYGTANSLAASPSFYTFIYFISFKPHSGKRNANPCRSGVPSPSSAYGCRDYYTQNTLSKKELKPIFLLALLLA